MHPLFYHNIPDLSSSYFKLVRTLLSCIPRSAEVERIISPGSSDEQNLFPDLSEEFFSSNPMFNYITFIRGSGIKIHEWLSSNISNNATRDQISKSFLVTNHLINFLCAYCSNYLQKLEFSFTVDLYSAFSNSVRNLTLLYNEGNNTSEKANSLSRFISLQNNLQHILLSENSIGFTLDNHISGFYNVVFESLSTQSESLRTLKLKNIPFNKLNGEALNSLCLLKNIRVLELYNCIRIDDNDDNLKEWAENLTRLEVFELVSQHIRDVSEGFLIQLIQSSSNELILIFKSCTQLVYLSIILSDDELWGTKFKDLGELIPRKLQKIRIKRMDDLLFSSSELKCFFEGCVNNNGKLKYLEIHDGEYIARERDQIEVDLNTQHFYVVINHIKNKLLSLPCSYFGSGIDKMKRKSVLIDEIDDNPPMEFDVEFGV
uniref:F-box domain-containing protein n=1 Tax=Rhizophagus irregularis (strain DAOM 181602 / DAOM 197198 / MUCL 43194) TaxID=747089 RepID=U9TZI0_RHIID